MKILRLVTIIAVLMTSIWVIAQEDSRANEPNWCYDGEPWGDGRCNDPDSDIQAYNWQMGWLFAQCDLGNIAREICYPPVEVDDSSYEIRYAFRSISGTPEAGSYGIAE